MARVPAELTPRFPEGLTVVAAYGQWRSPSGLMIKEPSLVLVIWYRFEAATEVAIEAIRAAYNLQFGQESVLRVDGASCVSL